MEGNRPHAATDLLNVVVPDGRDGDRQVRLSLSLGPAVADVIKGYARERGITITEAVRRAVSLLAFAARVDEDPNAKIAVVRRGGVAEPVHFEWK
ncbi:MAG TPA: hypothetical protein VJ914_09545 [Pseudonocardiaceae bacterium]|nr:hypothetical protein [Pseudonocardiaceae bacterium]